MFGFKRSVVYLLLFAMIFINFIDRITLSMAGKTIAANWAYRRCNSATCSPPICGRTSCS